MLLLYFLVFQILALHGYHQSDTVFSAKLGSLRKYFKKNVEFVFVKAPHEVSQFPSPDEEDVPNTGKNIIPFFAISNICF